MDTSSQANLPANTAIENSRLKAVFNFFQHIGESDTGKFEVGKDFARPFSVERSNVEEIDLHVRRRFEKHSFLNVGFTGNVKFADASNRRFDNLDDLLQDSANDKAPEYLSLQWKSFELLDDGKPRLAKVFVIFATEKRKESGSAIFSSIGDPTLELRVEGSSDVWTADTFEATKPFCENLCLKAPFSWLRIFGDNSVIMISVLLTLTSTFGYGQIWWRQRQLAKKEIEIEKLLSQFDNLQSSRLQMSKLYEAILDRQHSSNIDFSIETFPLLIASMIGALFLVPRIFSYLYPSSYIFIGIAGRSKQKYINIIRFVVVNVLILGILLPVIMKYVLE